MESNPGQAGEEDFSRMKIGSFLQTSLQDGDKSMEESETGHNWQKSKSVEHTKPSLSIEINMEPEKFIENEIASSGRNLLGVTPIGRQQILKRQDAVENTAKKIPLICQSLPTTPEFLLGPLPLVIKSTENVEKEIGHVVEEIQTLNFRYD